MPRYHVVVAAVARPNGDTECLSSIRPGRMSRYTSPRPMGPFPWPMDDLTREQGEQAMTYEDVMAYVRNTGRTYWIGRFYKNYNGLLDGYITFSHSERYFHFIMDYDPQHVHIGEDYDGYPTPAHFYLARSAIMTGTSWTIAEYDADAPMLAGPIPTALPTDADAVAMINALGLETINEKARQAAAEAEISEITEKIAAHAENKNEVPITETMTADEAAMAKTGTDDNA